jgi:anti-sigma regulatory factor (Ser/Thr protein kinase)
MKIIAHNFNNNNLKYRVECFSAKEGFECAHIKDVKEDKINDILILFTNIHKEVDLLYYNFIPLCCIGFKPDSKIFCHQLEDDFNIYQFRAILDTVYHSGFNKTFITETMPVYLKKKYIFSNRIFNVEDVAYSITREFVYYLSFYELQKIRIGLSEMITNAIEHGNLEITGEEKFKATEAGTYIDLLREKLKQKIFMDKKVLVNIFISNKKIIFEIEDEGKGFNKSVIREFSNKRNVNLLHGRGIMITKLYFDKVTYNNRGNKVKLIKKFE